MLTDSEAHRCGPPLESETHLKNAFTITVAYVVCMFPHPQVYRQFGGEVGLALRLLYRTFAEHDSEALEFTGWVDRFDVPPHELTLDVAISVLRASHAHKVPLGEVAFLYIGIDEFGTLNSAASDPTGGLLASVVDCIGRPGVMSHPPTDTFIIGIITGPASMALEEAFDRCGREAICMPLRAPLLSMADAEAMTQAVPRLKAAQCQLHAVGAFRRCLAGQFDRIIRHMHQSTSCSRAQSAN